MILLRLALASVWSRKGSALLTMMAIAVSVFVLMAVEQVRLQAKNSFGNTVSGIDLIVGARTGDINLLLYSVFRIGHATNNVSWQSYQRFASHPQVAWAIPIALGDSHKGFPVVGTNSDYFTHFNYGNKKPLSFGQGKSFASTYDVVLGSEVARKLGYSVGHSLVLAHGMASTSFSKHTDSPFKTVGILSPTGTPVDQALYVPLAAIDAIHAGWQQGAATPTNRKPNKDEHEHEHENLNGDVSLSAFMVGLKSKLATFTLQRTINNYPEEPLSAILPGVTLSQLWQLMATMENTLRIISLLVLLAAEFGLAAMLLASIRERNREITVLRAIGAPPWLVLLLIQAEAFIITTLGCLLGLALLSAVLAIAAPTLADHYGLFISANLLTPTTVILLGLIIASVFIVAFIPSIAAYRRASLKQF